MTRAAGLDIPARSAVWCWHHGRFEMPAQQPPHPLDQQAWRNSPTTIPPRTVHHDQQNAGSKIVGITGGIPYFAAPLGIPPINDALQGWGVPAKAVVDALANLCTACALVGAI